MVWVCRIGSGEKFACVLCGNEIMLEPATKHLGVLKCSEKDTPEHPFPHVASLVGKDEQGEWRSKGSEEYTSQLSGLIA